MNKNCYQTPTGWKFFGSLLENQKISLCGEESFGAGSFHLMEKDGLWAVLFWLNLIAITKKSPEQLVRDMWQRYGRIYNKTFSYTTSSAEKANHLMDVLSSKLPSLKGQNIEGLTVSNAQFFNYTDPVSKTQYMHQAILIDFNETDQVMVRLSGTVSSGACMKVYLHHKDNNADLSVEEAIEPLSKAVQTLLNIQKYLGDDVEITTT